MDCVDGPDLRVIDPSPPWCIRRIELTVYLTRRRVEAYYERRDSHIA
jgi:hypothetical protein